MPNPYGDIPATDEPIKSSANPYGDEPVGNGPEKVSPVNPYGDIPVEQESVSTSVASAPELPFAGQTISATPKEGEQPKLKPAVKAYATVYDAGAGYTKGEFKEGDVVDVAGESKVFKGPKTHPTADSWDWMWKGPMSKEVEHKVARGIAQGIHKTYNIASAPFTDGPMTRDSEADSFSAGAGESLAAFVNDFASPGNTALLIGLGGMGKAAEAGSKAAQIASAAASAYFTADMGKALVDAGISIYKTDTKGMTDAQKAKLYMDPVAPAAFTLLAGWGTYKHLNQLWKGYHPKQALANIDAAIDTLRARPIEEFRVEQPNRGVNAGVRDPKFFRSREMERQLSQLTTARDSYIAFWEKHLEDMERLRQSPEGAALLRQQLGEEADVSGALAAKDLLQAIKDSQLRGEELRPPGIIEQGPDMPQVAPVPEKPPVAPAAGNAAAMPEVEVPTAELPPKNKATATLQGIEDLKTALEKNRLGGPEQIPGPEGEVPVPPDFLDKTVGGAAKPNAIPAPKPTPLVTSVDDSIGKGGGTPGGANRAANELMAGNPAEGGFGSAPYDAAPPAMPEVAAPEAAPAAAPAVEAPVAEAPKPKKGKNSAKIKPKKLDAVETPESKAVKDASDAMHKALDVLEAAKKAKRKAAAVARKQAKAAPAPKEAIPEVAPTQATAIPEVAPEAAPTPTPEAPAPAPEVRPDSVQRAMDRDAILTRNARELKAKNPNLFESIVNATQKTGKDRLPDEEAHKLIDDELKRINAQDQLKFTPIVLYRGVGNNFKGDINEAGDHWSTDIETAKKFAGDNGTVHKIVIDNIKDAQGLAIASDGKRGRDYFVSRRLSDKLMGKTEPLHTAQSSEKPSRRMPVVADPSQAALDHVDQVLAERLTGEKQPLPERPVPNVGSEEWADDVIRKQATKLTMGVDPTVLGAIAVKAKNKVLSIVKPEKAEAEKFIQSIREEYPTNPINEREVIVNDALVELSTNMDGGVEIKSIRSLEQGKGQGRKSLQAIMDSKSIPSEDVAYHLGDLRYGRDTTSGRMSGQRGTGHLGTGVYLTSSPEKSGLGSFGSENRPVHRVNLSGYNLWKPNWDSYVQDRRVEAADADIHTLNEGLRAVNILVDHPNDADAMHRAVFNIGLSIPRKLTGTAADIESNIRKITAETSKDVDENYGKRPKDAYNQSASARLMQSYGYDGIDTRGSANYDNRDYGTVVYAESLKPEMDKTSSEKPVDSATSASVDRVFSILPKSIAGMEAWATNTLKQARENGRLNGGIPIDLWAAMVVKGVYDIKNGVRDFAAWSSKQIGEFGEGIRPDLRKLYDESVKKADTEPKEMPEVGEKKKFSDEFEEVSAPQKPTGMPRVAGGGAAGGPPKPPKPVAQAASPFPDDPKKALKEDETGDYLKEQAKIAADKAHNKLLERTANAAIGADDLSEPPRLFDTNVFSPSTIDDPDGYRLGLTSIPVLGDLAEKIKRYAGITQNNIWAADKRAGGMIREYSYDMARQGQEFQRTADKFSLIVRRNLTDDQIDTYGNFLMNGKLEEAQAFVDKNTNVGDEFRLVVADVQKAYEKSLVMQQESRVDPVNSRPNYFARKVADYEGLIKSFDRIEKTIFENALDAAREEKGRDLTMPEKGAVLNNLLRDSSINRGKPGFLKERTIHALDSNISRFYEPVDVAMADHFRRVNEDYHNRIYFGKKVGDYARGKGRFGEMLADGVESGRISPESQQIIQDNVSDLFAEHLKYNEINAKWGRRLRMAQTAGNLGQIMSSIAQFSDVLNTAFHTTNFRNPLGGQSIQGYAAHIAAQMGAEGKGFEMGDINISTDHPEASIYTRGVGRSTTKFGRLTSKIAQSAHDQIVKMGVGIADQFNAGGMMNGFARSLSDTINHPNSDGYARLQKRYSQMFPDKWEAMFKAVGNKEYLKGSKMSEDAKFMIFNEMSDFRPMDKTGMAQGFNASGPMARNMWGLKSYWLTQIGLMRTRGYEKLKSKNWETQYSGLAYLVAFTAFVSAGQNVMMQYMRDSIGGKKTDLSEAVIGGILQTAGISKYNIGQVANANPAEAAASYLLPGYGLYKDAQKDASLLYDMSWGKKDGNGVKTVSGLKDYAKQSQMMKHVPLGGKIIYDRWGAGKTLEDKNRMLEMRGKPKKSTYRTIRDIFTPQDTKSPRKN